MNPFKYHFKGNNSEERFNRIGKWNCSVAVFGGYWILIYYSGSRCSVWNRSPLVFEGDTSTRHVCDRIVK